MNRVLRLVAAVVLLALAVFCAYGFVASFEPGDFQVFRIGYPLVGLLCLAAVWLIGNPRGPARS
jgi:hypothetical protein